MSDRLKSVNKMKGKMFIVLEVFDFSDLAETSPSIMGEDIGGIELGNIHD